MNDSMWRPLDYEHEVAWLIDRSDGNVVAGIDATGWPDHVWALHTMYEADFSSPYTWDDFARALPDDEDDAPVIGDVDLRDIGTATGIPLGFTPPPGDGWTRLRWCELTERSGGEFATQDVPPCYRWFPFSSFPAHVRPPTEGSMDPDLLEALVPHLIREAGEDECFASYCPLISIGDDDTPRCFRGPLSQLTDLLDRWPSALPSNLWAPDRSWLLYTDWDLMGTKVSGSTSLIAAIEADPLIDTIEWAAPT